MGRNRAAGTGRRNWKTNAVPRLRNTLAVAGAAAIALHGTRLFFKLFGYNLPYTMPQAPEDRLDSEAFVRFLSSTTDAAAHRHVRLEALRNGHCFYEAELNSIRNAITNVNLLFYEFLEGRIADRFLAALIERASAGVEVRLIVDAVGSIETRDSYFEGLRAAGGRVQWFNALGSRGWTHMDNRTHRKLMIVDGQVGFIGGAGVGDQWLTDGLGEPAWRDTIIRVEGSAVAPLVSAFSENWLDCSGEILSGGGQFPPLGDAGKGECLIVNSTPHGGSTKARVLFQTLIDCARSSIRITTPYFLPDRSARSAFIRAIQKRGVRIQIVTAGAKSDHPTLARLSDVMTLDLLRAGVEIYDYQPGMIHAKIMTIDDIWSVAGSTNFDHRSFALNDEVNIAAMDRDLTAQLDKDFADDMTKSTRRTVEEVKNRSASARIVERLEMPFRREA